MINKNHFFIISRIPIDLDWSKSKNIQYFKTFKYLYDSKEMTSTFGDELWFDDIKQATKFPSDNYSNCEAFYNVLNKDYDQYTYEITLYKYERSKIVPIKTFKISEI